MVRRFARKRKLPLHSATGRIHPFTEPPKSVGKPNNYLAVIDGIEAPIYREVLQAERSELYATEDRSESLSRLYGSGLFSAGRPGILALG